MVEELAAVKPRQRKVKTGLGEWSKNVLKVSSPAFHFFAQISCTCSAGVHLLLCMGNPIADILAFMSYPLHSGFGSLKELILINRQRLRD